MNTASMVWSRYTLFDSVPKQKSVDSQSLLAFDICVDKRGLLAG